MMKENSWLLATNCSTNMLTFQSQLPHMDPQPSLILGFKRRYTTWLIRLFFHIQSTHPFHTIKMQATIKSSKPIKREHEIKLALQDSLLVVRCQNVRIHHYEPSIALARARPCRGYQIHVDFHVSGQLVNSQSP